MALANESTARNLKTAAYPRETIYPDTRVRRQAKGKPGRLNVLSMWACILFCGAVFWFIAGQGAKIDALNYQIDNLSTKIQSTAAINASLTTKVDALSQPAHLLQAAEALGAKPAQTAVIQTSNK